MGDKEAMGEKGHQRKGKLKKGDIEGKRHGRKETREKINTGEMGHGIKGTIRIRIEVI